MSLFEKLRGLGAAAAGLTAAIAPAAVLLAAQRQYDRMSASLQTITGSAEKAQEAFRLLNALAGEMPFTLDQTVGAFTKLSSLGLTPSEKAIKSYGNTAAAMGKDLSQLIEAVADATTGEFERLKEFGIKTKQEGDKVAFTFRGITTTVNKSAQDIEAYLQKLGEVEFAGAMKNRMDTLDGSILRFQASWNSLLSSMAQSSSLATTVRGYLDTISEGLDDLAASFASGQFDAALDAQMGMWRDLGEEALRAFGIIDAESQFMGSSVSATMSKLSAEIVQVFEYMPANLKASFKLAMNEVSYFTDHLVNEAKFWGRTLAAPFTDDTWEQALADFRREDTKLSLGRRSSINLIMAERQTVIDSYEAQIAKAKQLRDEYLKNLKARRESNALAELGAVKGSGKEATSGNREADEAARKSAEEARKRREAEFQQLQADLATENETIARAHAERVRIIIENAKKGSALYDDLMARAQKKRDEELANTAEARGKQELEALRQSLLPQEAMIAQSFAKRMELIRAYAGEDQRLREELEASVTAKRDQELLQVEREKQAKIDALMSGFGTEQQIMLQQYEERRRLILEQEELTELQKQALLDELHQRHLAKLAEYEQAQISMATQAASSLFGSLADLAKNHAGEQSSTYRKLFAISKAFAIADSTMKISQGVANAMSLPWPQNLAEGTRVAAMGAKLLADISSSQFSGMYDKGGQIPAGKFGIVGEYGPEVVKGPATIRGRELTSRVYPEKQAPAPAPQMEPPKVTVKNVNVLDPSIVADFLNTDAGEQVIMNVVNRNRVSAAEWG